MGHIRVAWRPTEPVEMRRGAMLVMTTKIRFDDGERDGVAVLGTEAHLMDEDGVLRVEGTTMVRRS